MERNAHLIVANFILAKSERSANAKIFLKTQFSQVLAKTLEKFQGMKYLIQKTDWNVGVSEFIYTLQSASFK